MHILLAFFIGVALFTGFHPMTDPPKNVVEIAPTSGSPAVLHTAVTPASKIQYAHLIKQHFDYSCGSAALATILNDYIGEEFTEKQVIAGLLRYGDKKMIISRRAFSLLDMKRFVNVLGYRGVGYKATVDDLKTLKSPCIIPITVFNNRHFVVFKGIAGGHIFFADPFRGNTSYPLAEFEAHWYQNAIFVVYPKNKEPVLSALRLRDQDLRMIDEDAARKILFDNQQPWSQAGAWQVDKTLGNDTRIHSKAFNGYRSITTPKTGTTP